MITMKDFEIRYRNILEKNPNRKLCSSQGCRNPVDVTMLGEDTSCAYHRLLFDFWICDIVENEKSAWYYSHKKARRAAFTRWQHKIGKEQCDKIVFKMALEPINWKC